MSATAMFALCAILGVALAAFLAYMMALARHLKPHAPSHHKHHAPAVAVSERSPRVREHATSAVSSSAPARTRTRTPA